MIDSGYSQNLDLTLERLLAKNQGFSEPGSQAVRSRLVLSNQDVGAYLYQANCLEIMDMLIAKYPQGCFDMIFADPPYFLSNGGITCQAGKMVKVDKGKWDKSQGAEVNHAFNLEWLSRCQKLLKPNGTIWVSGTMHVIYSIGYAMQQLGYKVVERYCLGKAKSSPKPCLSLFYTLDGDRSLGGKE